MSNNIRGGTFDVNHDYFIRDAALENMGNVGHIENSDQRADMLTKLLNTMLLGKYFGALPIVG